MGPLLHIQMSLLFQTLLLPLLLPLLRLFLLCLATPLPRYPTRLRRPKGHTDGTILWPLPCSHATTVTLVPLAPTSVTEALKFPAWRQAMQLEFNALLDTHTWKLVPPSASQNLVCCKWIFQTKHLPNGCVERKKARLVAKGFHQQHGLNYSKTFSPVVHSSTVRLVLSLAVQAGWSMHQLDIQNTFLHVDLSEDVFMVQPPSFIHPDYPYYVCKLQKFLYRLKQAPQASFSKLSSKLLELVSLPLVLMSLFLNRFMVLFVFTSWSMSMT